jgi:CheY-like chemotaxis protein/DNA-directed RNA polymerase specialized sigma24 family protein
VEALVSFNVHTETHSGGSPKGDYMSLATTLAPHLPFLRRYARALTGAQSSGDRFVAATLEAIIANPDTFPNAGEPRLFLYKTFHAVCENAYIDGDLDPAAGPEAKAQERLRNLTPIARQALLLTTLEGFTADEASAILARSPEETNELIASAIAEIDRQTKSRVLIIEDEPIIAIDLGQIVEGLGHSVVATADTASSAVEAAARERPELVLADIQLADGSSGIDAVKDILGQFKVPVIFITAYPDRLLTGERPEPTFLITKPFLPETVQAAISQALFFQSSSRLH